MSTKIIIDGYNLLWQSTPLREAAITNFEKGRESLIQWFSKMPRLQEFDVTVVFDAHKTEALHPSEEIIQGIQVVYTARGQTADDLIRSMAGELGPAAIIVSSDHEIARYAEKKGCGVLGSREFQIALERPETFQFDPSRRFSKAKRRALSRLL